MKRAIGVILIAAILFAVCASCTAQTAEGYQEGFQNGNTFAGEGNVFHETASGGFAEIGQDSIPDDCTDQVSQAPLSPLMEEFTTYGKGCIDPAQFGGAFLEDDRLIVQLVSPSDGEVLRYREYFESLDSTVEFREVEYSYSELMAAVELAADTLMEHQIQFAKYYVDVLENCGRIALMAEAYDAYLRQEELADLDFGAPVVVEGLSEGTEMVPASAF